MPRSRLRFALLTTLTVLAAGCGSADPGTSVRLAVTYDDALGLDDAEVKIAERSETGPPAHELLLLVADAAADSQIEIAVWGRKAGARVAYGTATVTPRRGVEVSARLELSTCMPGCAGNQLRACGPPVSCALGCSVAGAPHCVAPAMSNGVMEAYLDGVTEPILIADDTLIDGDTGAITGGLSRAAGTGIDHGIGFTLQSTTGDDLAVFAFRDLTIGGNVRITGTHAVVLLVGESVTMAGVIDVAGGHDSPASHGPGGGVGSTERDLAGGCGPGGPGGKAVLYDSGGGGGGAASEGGLGGPAGASQALAGGDQGSVCFTPELEPLRGGSGGGRGGRGSSASSASGGGGGGALQITALVSLEITGTIDAGGAGGALGAPGNGDGDTGGGGGGGAGGAILLEAPQVTVASTAILVANGGGGGGGGGPGIGYAGQNGPRGAFPAMGGAGAALDLPNNGGGSGGANAFGDFGSAGELDGGGGGGSYGTIVIRGRDLSVAGTISPPARQLDVHPPI